MAVVRYAGVYAQQDGKEYGYSLPWPQDVPQQAMASMLEFRIRHLGVEAPLTFAQFEMDLDDRGQQAEDEEA